MKREQRISYVFDAVLLAYDITAARLREGMTQSDTAQLIAVSSTAIGRWEQARGALLTENLLLICNLFDLNPTDYWCLEGTQARSAEHARRIRRDGHR